MRYLRATTTPFRFRPFAFAFRAFACDASCATFHSQAEHFLSRGAETVRHHVATEHTSDLLDPRGVLQPRHRRPRPAALNSFLDGVVRIRVCGNLRQV